MSVTYRSHSAKVYKINSVLTVDVLHSESHVACYVPIIIMIPYPILVHGIKKKPLAQISISPSLILDFSSLTSLASSVSNDSYDDVPSLDRSDELDSEDESSVLNGLVSK